MSKAESRVNIKLWRLEAVRGLAALYVAIGHAVGHTAKIAVFFRFGQEAVIVFFLISGFVIELSYTKGRDKTFGGYFIRRFIRIYGVFVPMLLVCIVTLTPNFQEPSFWRILAGNFAMLQDFSTGKPNVIVPTIFASALWSLHYEWWFYMLYYPVKTSLRQKCQSYLVTGTSVASALLYIWFPYVLPRLLMYFVIWWTGVDMARSYESRGRAMALDIKVTFIGTIIVSGILIANCFAQGRSLQLGIHPYLELRHFLAAIAIVAVAFAWQRANWRGFTILRMGKLIAPISYSLYISHQPLLINASYLTGISNLWIRYSCYAIAMLAFCWATELKLYPFLRKLVTRLALIKP